MNFYRIFKSIKGPQLNAQSLLEFLKSWKNIKTLTVGPHCQLPRHCGARENTGAMDAALPCSPLAPPRAWPPPRRIKTPSATCCLSSPPFSSTCRTLTLALRNGRALTVRRRTPPSTRASRSRSSRGKRTASSSSSSSSAQSGRDAVDRAVGLVFFVSVRRAAATIPSPSNPLRHRRAAVRAQDELVLLLDLSPLSLSLCRADSVDAALEPPRQLIAGAFSGDQMVRPSAT